MSEELAEQLRKAIESLLQGSTLQNQTRRVGIGAEIASRWKLTRETNFRDRIYSAQFQHHRDLLLLLGGLVQLLTDQIAANAKLVGQIEEIRRRYPAELKGLLKAAHWQHLNELMPLILQQPLPKRTKPVDAADRIERIKESKRRYDAARRFDGREKIGRIEQQFGLGLSNARFHDITTILTREGDCLDDLMRGDCVARSGNRRSLEDLFGVYRQYFPKGLPCIKKGSKQGYDYNGFLICADALLRSNRWLPDPSMRLGIFKRIERRLSMLSPSPPAEVATAFRRFFKKQAALIR